MVRNPIDYARLNDALLERVDTLLAEWLSAGTERNGRWYVGDFDGSPGESANVNMRTGQWIDNGGGGEDCGGDLISLYARIHNLSNHEAAMALMERLGWITARDDDRRQAVQASAPAGPSGPPEPPPEAMDGEAPPAPRRKREPKWRVILPVPKHAPQPKFRFGFKNKKTNTYDEFDAVRTWAYRINGTLLGYVARFERVDSKGELVKDAVPLTWCENLEDDRGGQRWHWKQWEAPRPLYVPAEGIVPQLPVLVVEGEKCAEEAHKLIGTEFTVVAWPGGCKAWAVADWSWLKGLTVYLWPDVDHQHERLTKAEREAGVEPSTKPELPAHKQPGMVAMMNVGTELQARLGCQVYLCPVLGLGTQKDGWDVADAIAEGWDVDRLRAFIRSSPTFVSHNDEARAMVGKKIASGAAAEEGDGGESIGWRHHLLVSSTGTTKAVRENAVLALDGLPEKGIPGAEEAAGVIAFDEFSNNVIKLRAAPWGTDAGVWQEEDELEMGAWLARSLYLPPMPRGTLEEATLMVAKRHKVHPVRQAVEGLRGLWDGQKRLGTWLQRVCMHGKDVDEATQQYLARAGAWFVMAMCARVMTPQLRGSEVVIGPGCKFDYMLIFEGPQGWGKSTIAKILGGEFYADTGLILGEKDSYQNIQGIHVYEWGELDSMSKADVKLVKLFIASAKDRFRATFDRRPRDYPRQVVFVGTTNEEHYMTDATGNRRFWPVKLLVPADLEWLRENRAQLLAEALVHLDAGVRFHPTIAEQRKWFDPQQAARMRENSIDSLIRDYLYNADQKVPHMGENGTLVNSITLTTLLSRIGYTHDKQSDVVVAKAGQTMTRLGWTTTRPTDASGLRPRVYHRPKDEPAAWAVTKPASASSGPSSPAQGEQPVEASDGCPV